MEKKCSFHALLTEFVIVGWLYAMFLIGSNTKLLFYIVALSIIISLYHRI